MNNGSDSKHIAVVGGGPGGYAAAFLAADLGLKVTLIDNAPNPGGVCLYRGCIPSKALLHIAKLIDESRHASEWGIEFQEPTIHLEKLRSWKQSVVPAERGAEAPACPSSGGYQVDVVTTRIVKPLPESVQAREKGTQLFFLTS